MKFNAKTSTQQSQRNDVKFTQIGLYNSFHILFAYSIHCYIMDIHWESKNI